MVYVYIINQQTQLIISTISAFIFRDLYLEVIECLNDINRSIYGFPVIVSFIASINVGLIFFLLFHTVIFNESNDTTKNIQRKLLRAFAYQIRFWVFIPKRRQLCRSIIKLFTIKKYNSKPLRIQHDLQIKYINYSIKINTVLRRQSGGITDMWNVW